MAPDRWSYEPFVWKYGYCRNIPDAVLQGREGSDRDAFLSSGGGFVFPSLKEAVWNSISGNEKSGNHIGYSFFYSGAGKALVSCPFSTKRAETLPTGLYQRSETRGTPVLWERKQRRQFAGEFSAVKQRYRGIYYPKSVSGDAVRQYCGSGWFSGIAFSAPQTAETGEWENLSFKQDYDSDHK